MNMTLSGTLNGVPGYTVTLRAGDFGSPGNFINDGEIGGSFDTIRIELSGQGLTYDTTSHFTNLSSCQGPLRTGLDNGNLSIEF